MEEIFGAWVSAHECLPEIGRTVIFLTESMTSAIGCIQEVRGRLGWYTEFAPWGDHDQDMPLDPDDPEETVTYWMPFYPPPPPAF